MKNALRFAGKWGFGCHFRCRGWFLNSFCIQRREAMLGFPILLLHSSRFSNSIIMLFAPSSPTRGQAE
ncbi:MAG: hypothetical protein WAL20_18385, partial [Rhodomicrobium sp.]